MTKAEQQARDYAAEADDDAAIGAALAVRIAEWLRRKGMANAGACVIAWQDESARLHIERRRHNDAMQEVLSKLYALRDGQPRTFDRGGLPPAESSD